MVFAREAVRLAENPRQPLALLAARRELGALLAEVGSFDDATAQLTASLDLAVRCQTPYERALTLTEIGELDLRQGDPAAASDVLSEAKVILERLGAIPALSQVTRLRQQLRSMNEREARHGLSERELEVLRLVAQGLTDRQIGDQLFISRRTVSQHMRSIFNKLNVGSRTAAALAAVELHLLDA
jgi:DNA-binding CsgD family transcriptional regulator